jgi:hypothetical protein
MACRALPRSTERRREEAEDVDAAVPYSDLVGDRDPVAVLAETPARIQELVALYRRLTREQRDRPIRHPEFGGISVAWIIRVLAGHDLHHLQHLRTIAER